MTAVQTNLTYRKLTPPNSAAIAGVIFAMLYGTCLVVIRASIPEDPAAESAWLESNTKTISFALNLVPYAGIAFLWFIGVVRTRLGDMEDRLFATVFLGSGLLFLTLTFAGATLASGLTNSYIVAPNVLVESGVFTYSRSVMHQTINVYAVRMAGVFMISLGTIWIRTGLMRRGWVLLTYALALVLLLIINYSLWVTLIFPIWVLVVSIYFLILNFRRKRQDPSSEI